MNFLEILSDASDRLQNYLNDSGIPQYVTFAIFALFSIAIGRTTPHLVEFITNRFLPENAREISNNFILPLHKPFQASGTFILISLSLVWLKNYQELYDFIRPFINLGVVISLAWLTSRLFRQLVRIYGIELIRKSGLEVDELLLVFETIANVIIGLIAIIAYAQSQNFPLTGLLASVSIGGLAISFAASKTLEQLLGTIVLYLDRPFVAGEYIRLPDGLYGRVESIGLRSTKIRAAAKSTLFIIPNGKLVDMQIENVTRGKKVMVLLYLDFTRKLEAREEALVQQVVKKSTDSVFGIDPGSTKIAVFDLENTGKSRARVTFFILGSSENSIQLKKRLLEIANHNISKDLKSFRIEFSIQEPNIYVESPVTM